ncbi:MAG: methyltransferase domain-containing protein [Rhodobacteraceae bacterium]|nr:methyltransferase domain-containing protein [Paracoccaceae bacterium]
MTKQPDEKTRQLHNVYDSQSANETAEIYDGWADDYEAHMAGVGYSHPAMVASMLCRHQKTGNAPMLDAGAGTGIMAEILGALGYPAIFGFDASPGMLRLAKARDIYADLRVARLGEPLDYETNQFAAAVASGVFTQGHAPLSGLNELIRITRPGGHIVFSIARSYLGSAFAEVASELEQQGKWHQADATQRYDSTPMGQDNLMAQVFAFRVE